MEYKEKVEIIHQYALDLDTSTIFIVGELDGSLGMLLRMKISCIKQYYVLEHGKLPKEINIVINSTGGDATIIGSVMDLYEELKAEGILVNVHAEGQCMSACTFFVAGATGVRSAGKRTRFMVHELQLSGIEGTHTQVKSFQGEVERMQEEGYQIYADISLSKKKKPSKIEIDNSIKNWKKMCEKETYFSSEEAVKYGLIDIVR